MLRKSVLPAIAVLFLAGCWGSSDNETSNKDVVSKETTVSEVKHENKNASITDGEETKDMALSGSNVTAMNDSSAMERQTGSFQEPASSEPMTQETKDLNNVVMEKGNMAEEVVNIQPMSNKDTTITPLPVKDDSKKDDSAALNADDSSKKNQGTIEQLASNSVVNKDEQSNSVQKSAQPLQSITSSVEEQSPILGDMEESNGSVENAEKDIIPVKNSMSVENADENNDAENISTSEVETSGDEIEE